MSKKSRDRRAKNAPRPDKHFSGDDFQIARFGANIVVKNKRTPEKQTEHMESLTAQYPAKYESLNQKVTALKKIVSQCDPYSILMYFRSKAIIAELNVFSEVEYSAEDVAIFRAQEYIQSILISTPNEYIPSNPHGTEEKLYDQILADVIELYKEVNLFYFYWAAQKQTAEQINKKLIDNIVEAQYMYLVRGNRYQIFELEPLRILLPPHDDILRQLFGVSATEVINGLEKLQYSLSQGVADAMMEMEKEYLEFVRTVTMGVNPKLAMERARKRAPTAARKAFGDALIDVKAITGWDDRFIALLSAGVNECEDFWTEGDFAGWPIVEQPVIRKPFIKIGRKTYAFLYYVLFDNIYRNVQRGILKQKPQYIECWKTKQTRASEEMVRDIFLKLLPGAEAHVGNYYPKNTSTKQMNENDIIIIFQNYLFVIEVKAGSFPVTPPIIDFNAHIEAYRKLAETADSQCSRTCSYISKHTRAQFYNQDKQPTFQVQNLKLFNGVFTFSVTVDNFNEFAARAEKLSIIALKEETIVISYDDLLSYAGYFDSPILFLHYLKQRKAAMRVPQFHLQDELDHLGLYIDKNLYAINSSQYRKLDKVFYHGFREKLDDYFQRLYVDPQHAKKPTQGIPAEINAIIKYLEQNLSPDNITLAHFFLDFSSETREAFAEQIRNAQKREAELHCVVPAIAVGEVKYCAFVEIPDIVSISIEDQLDYTYAVASRNEAVPVMCILLKYDRNNELASILGKLCFFADVPEKDMDRIKMMGEKKAKRIVRDYIKTHGKIGRNDECPCGSGRKYKRCCLKQ